MFILPGVVEHTYNPSSLEREVRELPHAEASLGYTELEGIPDQQRLHSKSLFQIKQTIILIWSW